VAVGAFAAPIICPRPEWHDGMPTTSGSNLNGAAPSAGQPETLAKLRTNSVGVGGVVVHEFISRQ